MKKLITLASITVISAFFGFVAQWQALPTEQSQMTEVNYLNYGGTQTSKQEWWNGYTTPSEQKSDVVIPYSEEASSSEEAQAYKKAKEEAERKAKECKEKCCWIKLNTNFPIIWNCIETKAGAANPTNAFPYLMWALTKIIMSLIMVVCFILVIVAWIMWAADKPKEWKELLKKVAITILLLGFSWVILRLINPNFFS